MGINERNLEYIYPNNQRADFPLSDNKLLTKEFLVPRGVPMPETYRVYQHFFELASLERDLQAYQAFVIKPASGSGGSGILVIKGRSEQGWLAANGRVYSVEDLVQHISDIIFGVYSFDLKDSAIIEAIIHPHPFMQEMSPLGLADIRIILHQDKPVLAMTRLPTSQSGGRANLHQGAVAVGIDLASGKTTHAIQHNQAISQHPDTRLALLHRQLPCWDELIGLGQKIATYLPLKYIGIDLVLAEQQYYLLEINVRPGLQIQIANQTGLRSLLDQHSEDFTHGQ
jgi:alpha-L-glutamate ligase-like protein